jgi:hypothetical protein
MMILSSRRRTLARPDSVGNLAALGKTRPFLFGER